MPSGGEESGPAGGLLASVRKLGATLVAALQTRLELLSTEAEEHIARLARLWVYAAVALFLLALGVIGASLFIVVLYWDTHRLAAIGSLTVFYMGAGLAVAGYARREARTQPRLFASSLAELAKDRRQLEAD